MQDKHKNKKSIKYAYSNFRFGTMALRNQFISHSDTYFYNKYLIKVCKRYKS